MQSGKSELAFCMESVLTRRGNHPHTTHALHILCGVPYIVDAASFAITDCGCNADSQASVKFVIDAPIGYALSMLATLDDVGTKILVTTFNCCPEYVEDLWDCGPAALLAGESLVKRLSDVLDRVDRGERFRLAPGCGTPLTPSERRVLRGLAQGWDNAQLSRQLRLRSSTVTNALTRIYRKIGVESRTEAMLHYWGVWPPVA